MRRIYLFILCMCVTATVVAANKHFTLVIDAGHGGNDAGAVGKITKEKTINLNVALAFGKLVEQNCPDVKVIYTRKTDVFIPLHTRADIANKNKADLFISIHTNALPKGRISRGLETYTLGMHRAADNLAVAKRENEVILYEKDYKQRYQGFDPNSSESYIMFEFMQDHNMAQSVELAKFVQRRTCASAGRLDKGVKQAGFLVLRETSMPSCLIELGFISTPDEESFLNSTAGVNQLGRGIYQAFVDYKRKYDTDVSVTYKEEPQQQEVKTPAVAPETPKQEVKQETKKESKKEKKRKKKEAEEKVDTAVAEKPAAPAEKPAAPVEKPVDKTVAPVEKKDTVAQPAPAPVPEEKPAAPVKTTVVASSAPVFKVQILASSSKLSPSAPQLKGQQDIDSYEEGGLYKFTVGASTDYNEIYQLRKSLLDKFPQAFIIAFKDGQKTDVRKAIEEFKNRKVKK
ncbi:MAG: N-acetylmuramoyl-L-alanine amidase [Prevotella sp.]|nr:N-acetylmuramoyl-L-alanine amidase [Prevotella sp.]